MAVEEREAAAAPGGAAAAPDIRLENVTKRFDDVMAVDDLSLTIERGQVFALLVPLLLLRDEPLKGAGISLGAFMLPSMMGMTLAFTGLMTTAQLLATELNTLTLSVSQGMFWTTDAPYRETESQLAEHAAAGVLAVEMQAASLFAFGAARQVPVGVVAHVTNAVDHTGQPFDKGQDVSGESLLEAVCRAGHRFISASK